jgi:hypothetical protein
MEPMPDREHASRSGSGWGAAWPAAVPVLCAVHCIAAPLLVLFVPSLAPNPRVEAILLVATFLFTAAVLTWGVRSHGNVWVWLPTLAGLALWAGAHATLHGRTELLTETAGALLVAGGLTWSAWLRHRANCRDCRHPQPQRGR